MKTTKKAKMRKYLQSNKLKKNIHTKSNTSQTDKILTMESINIMNRPTSLEMNRFLKKLTKTIRNMRN